MNVERIRAYLLTRKLSITIILIVFLLGSAVGFTIAQAFRDPTSSLTIVGTVIAIIASIITMFKFFSDHRKSMNIPSLEYGYLIARPRSFGEGGGTRKQFLFLLQVKELKGRGQKVNGCEGFIDIPQARVTHSPLYWVNGNRRTISIGLIEELQLFTLSSLIKSNTETGKRLLFYAETGIDGHLGYGLELDFENVDINSEVIITVQVDQGGSAPPKPYKMTIKQILETMPTG